MCTTCATLGFDQAQADAFGQRMVQMLNDAATAMMISIGHRTRLLDTMSDGQPGTTRQIAEKAGLNERYVREWLGAMTCARIVTHDPADQTYRLPPEHAAFLTRAATPNNVAGAMQWISVLGGAEDEVTEAFTHGRGVPYSAYGRFHEVMIEESNQTVLAGLEQHIIPLVAGLEQRLERGINVVDVGCGSGRAIMHLAERYPYSHFTGLDFSPEAITAAGREARQRGLTNIEFRVQDAATWQPEPVYDLVTTFDAVHDQANPAQVLANIHAALRPGGVYLMQDIGLNTPVHQNLEHPLAAFVYTISCMHCMSVSLASGGAGLGAAWGRQQAMQMLTAAGFDDVTRQQLPHDILNDYFIARRAA